MRELFLELPYILEPWLELLRSGKKLRLDKIWDHIEFNYSFVWNFLEEIKVERDLHYKRELQELHELENLQKEITQRETTLSSDHGELSATTEKRISSNFEIKVREIDRDYIKY